MNRRTDIALNLVTLLPKIHCIIYPFINHSNHFGGHSMVFSMAYLFIIQHVLEPVNIRIIIAPLETHTHTNILTTLHAHLLSLTLVNLLVLFSTCFLLKLMNLKIAIRSFWYRKLINGWQPQSKGEKRNVFGWHQSETRQTSVAVGYQLR